MKENDKKEYLKQSIKIRCPIHNTLIAQEPISFLNAWFCHECNTYYAELSSLNSYNSLTIQGKKVYPISSEHIKETTVITEIKTQVPNRIWINPDPKTSPNSIGMKKAKPKREKVVFQNSNVGSTKREFKLPPPPPNALILPSIITSTPKTALAKVTLDSKMNCIIVEDVKEQNTKEGIFWVGRSLPNILILAIIKNEKRISYKNNPYMITDIKLFSRYKSYYEHITHFCNTSKPKEICVFNQKNIDRYTTDEYEMITALVFCAREKDPIPMTVYYSSFKDFYFINKESYTAYSEKYGLPFLNLRPVDTQYAGANMELCENSELNLYGYSVGKNSGLSDIQRQGLLADLINTGLMPKHKIVNHLEWLIHMRKFQFNMEDACSIWRDDLRFVLGYKANMQKMIWGEFVIRT